MRFLIVLALLCPILSFSQQNRSKPSAPISPVNTQHSTLNPSPPSSVNSHLSSPPTTVNSQRSSLTIGDTLPPGTLNYKPTTTNHKLSILDFWATWCTSCLKHFPQLDSFQQQYNGQVQVLLVNSRSTGDDEQKIKAFFQKWKAPNGSSFSLPTLVGDTVFSRLFPHSTLPHYVWLNRAGRILAITGSEELTAANIQKAIGEEALTLRTKADVINYDADKPLLVGGNGGTGEALRFHSLISGHIQGLPCGTRIRQTPDGLYTKLTFTNNSILGLYQLAFNNTFPLNRIRLHVPDTTLVTKSTEWGEWRFTNTFCYEILLPPTTKERALARMQQDLQAFFGYTAVTEVRLLDTWVLQGRNTSTEPSNGQSPAENLFGPGPKYITSKPLASFIKELNNQLPLPVCNEATGSSTLTLSLPDDINDISQVNKCLRPLGLQFTLQKRPWPVFIIRGNPKPTYHPPTGNSEQD